MPETLIESELFYYRSGSGVATGAMKLSAADERKLRQIFEESYLNDYPDPDRVGCPDPGYVRMLPFDRKVDSHG